MGQDSLRIQCHQGLMVVLVVEIAMRQMAAVVAQDRWLHSPHTRLWRAEQRVRLVMQMA